jgi:hypothetical protein
MSQLVVVSNGQLFHTIGDGLPSQDFRQVDTSGVGAITAVACAAVGEDMHVVVLLPGVQDGEPANKLFHNIRYANGGWQGFVPLSQGLPNPNTEPDVTSAVACVGVGDTLQVYALAGEQVFYTVRDANENWQDFNSVASIVATANEPGAITALACSD